jgi:purine-cytosine permease-like protein
MLYPRAFAKFLLTLLVLSGINTNVISIYSAAISFQQLARPFARIPRVSIPVLQYHAPDITGSLYYLD